MINGPGYLSPQAGMSMVQYDSQLNQACAAEQMYDPVQADKDKRDAQKRMWTAELVDTARSLEYVRQRMVDMDMLPEAKALDGVIVAMVNRWNEERNAQR